MPQAACKHKNAIFGPTPCKEHSSSAVWGTSELKESRRVSAVAFRYLKIVFSETQYQCSIFTETKRKDI
jgi:hypothetical protein